MAIRSHCKAFIYFYVELFFSPRPFGPGYVLKKPCGKSVFTNETLHASTSTLARDIYLYKSFIYSRAPPHFILLCDGFLYKWRKKVIYWKCCSN